MNPHNENLMGSRVKVEMKSGRSITGLYSGWSQADAGVDEGYGARFVAAVQADTALGLLPVPGDTLRLVYRDDTRPPLDVRFLGVSDPARPGVYVRRPSGIAFFADARALAAILDSDGAPVSFRNMHQATVEGRIPSMEDPTGRILTVLSSLGPMHLRERDIKRVAVSREHRGEWAVGLGLLVDAALIYALVKALENMSTTFGM